MKPGLTAPLPSPSGLLATGLAPSLGIFGHPGQVMNKLVPCALLNSTLDSCSLWLQSAVFCQSYWRHSTFCWLFYFYLLCCAYLSVVILVHVAVCVKDQLASVSCPVIKNCDLPMMIKPNLADDYVVNRRFHFLPRVVIARFWKQQMAITYTKNRCTWCNHWRPGSFLQKFEKKKTAKTTLDHTAVDQMGH